jgi:peptide/nickel transport system ATP-binding protein
MPAPVLHVHDLHTSFGAARAVDGVSFDVAPSEAVGIVGESGCGKSVTALSLLRLIRPPGAIDPVSQIVFDDTDVMQLDPERLRAVRGARMAMIFQEPMTALNPVYRVGDQIAEVLRVHGQPDGAWDRAVEMLRLTGIPDPASRARAYPHQLSGGMRQRVMIAMALVMHPALVIADEPTTALDVTVQAQILSLLSDLRTEFQSALLLITHDLGVIAEATSRVIVMYAGEIVEEAPVDLVFAQAHHPYTRGLLAAVPRLSDAFARRHRLADIPGSVPPATNWPTGCRFRTRCASAWDRCEREHPPLYQIGGGHTSRCHLADEPARRR